MSRFAFVLVLFPFDAFAHAAGHHTHVNPEILLLAALASALAVLRSR